MEAAMSTAGVHWLTGEQVTIFDLEQPRFQGMPIHEAHQPGYLYVLHRRHSDGYDPVKNGPRTGASGVIVCMEHSGTHIDAISHQADAQLLCGGIDANAVANSKGFAAGGVEEIDPIVARGVLLDVPAHRNGELPAPGEAISASELQAIAKSQGTEVRPGDVVLVRTGLGAIWDDPATYLAGPGMHGDASRWLAEVGVHAVGADNMAWDVIGLWDEHDGCTLPGHLVLLARRGIYIIENLMLEELAAAGMHEFTFMCTPLKFTGATGSPVRPLAIVPA
jgi:kynurenine formamidase